MAIKKMSNVAVAMQSALGISKSITVISKAAPGIVTCTHDFVNGDYVVLAVQGMSQLQGRVFRVVAIATTVSFQLEDVGTGVGISTLLFDTFTSGSAQKITFGTSITTMAEVTLTGGEFSKLDTTTIHTSLKSEIPGSASPISMDVKHLWDVADAGQLALKAASDSQILTAFKFTFGVGGTVMVFTGYVGHTGVPAGAAQEVLKTSSNISAAGLPTYYAS
ncbi:phage tail tube protein [Methylobacter sp. S3L5C]|uniref:phage tail tube protein n=1 Tax=Methylobacter sp. S3L5C TaxID=2839024 RepID=UPI001FAC29E1|nr:phage tail tube protein [Methylobacter sp. S3L5C]UOA08327.1 hypothetical protein KKZ03_19325 [Methylobacter sp. S3L5C]